MTQVGAKVTKPMGSRRSIALLKPDVVGAFSVLYLLWGIGLKKSINDVTAPAGRFTKKPR